MKTIKLLAFAMLLMSFSCSPEDEVINNDCDCVTTIYRLPVGTSTFTWHQTGLETDVDLNCDDDMERPLYYSSPNYFYQVEF